MIKFIFYGKILGYYYELDETNNQALKGSNIFPAPTKYEFIKNARKAYPNHKLIFNKVG